MSLCIWLNCTFTIYLSRWRDICHIILWWLRPRIFSSSLRAPIRLSALGIYWGCVGSKEHLCWSCPNILVANIASASSFVALGEIMKCVGWRTMEANAWRLKNWIHPAYLDSKFRPVFQVDGCAADNWLTDTRFLVSFPADCVPNGHVLPNSLYVFRVKKKY